MATYTITGTSAYENLTGPTTSGNDTYNINGGILTISTDTRWCGANRTLANGNIGNVTVSSTLGGQVIIDGTKVRIIQYNSGTGNVPAFGTVITQGSVSASLMGVWSTLASTPTASGAAMPTTGFIKIRNASGSFVVSALGGIGATAVSADQVGWIEVVGVEGTTMNIPRLGSCSAIGEWFTVGNTTGTSGTTYQLPASLNNTFYAGVWIETSASSNSYEFYPNAGSVASTAAPSDVRGKVCWISTQGLLRLGTSNGTNAGGYLPASGLKIRIPNIITMNCGSTATTTSANTIPNSTLGTRYDFTSTNAGAHYFDKVNFAWYPSFSQPYLVQIKNCGIMDQLNISEHAAPLDIDNVGVGCTQAQVQNPLLLASCFAGGEIKNSVFCRYSLAGSGAYGNSVNNLNGVTFRNIKTLAVTNKANAATGTWTVTNASNCNWYNCTNIGGRCLHATSVNCVISGGVYGEMFNGAVSTSYTHYCHEFTVKSNNCLVDSQTLLNTSGTNNHPYGGLVLSNASDYITLRNVGTSAAPLVFGTTNSPAVAFASTGNSSNLKMQRVYVANTRTFLFASNNSDSIVNIDNSFADYADTAAGIGWLNAQVRGCGCNITSAGQTSVYGSHWYNCFTSTTQGRVGILFNEKTTVEPSNSTYSILSGAPTFTSTGGLYMPTSGMSIEYTMPYYAKGYTAFQNVAPNMGGGTIGNYTIEYKIDTGSGYTSAYKILNGSNLSSEVITSDVGFKLKVKITTITNNTTAITGLNIFMTTTASAQYALYPLESLNRTLTLTNLQSGSEIRIYTSGTTNELAGIENSSTSYAYPYVWEGTDIPIDIVIFNLQYQPVYYYGYSLTNQNASLPVQQIYDRNYINPT